MLNLNIFYSIFFYSIFFNFFKSVCFLKNLNFINKYFLKKNLFFKKTNYEILKKNYFYHYYNLIFINSNFKKNYNFNYIFYKNFINIIYNFNLNNVNYLIFDNNKKYLYNLYINFFSLKNLLIYKNYFFIDNNYFTHKNFIYLYNQFLIDMNINSILIFNLKNILRFSHILESLGVILIVFNNYYNFIKCDYIFDFSLTIYTKYLFIFLLNNLWLISLNFLFFKKKLFYITYFFKFLILI